MTPPSNRIVLFLRWAGRVTSIFGLLIWGAFFIEHLAWFVKVPAETPPLEVWVGQILHLILLIGYVLAFWREIFGSLLILVGAVGFFLIAGGTNMMLFILVSILPALLHLGSWAIRNRA